jgi:lysophospholipase
MSVCPLPDLEPCFLPPEGWRSDSFENPETGHFIHYNYWLDETDRACIAILPGLSEFGEKYIETARFFKKHGFGLYVIDWAFQGRSTRFEGNRQKRHSDGYETDLSDLDYLMTRIIGKEKPLYVLGHSMGGHLGLRYLAQHPGRVKAAAFSAPMVDIQALHYGRPFFKRLLDFCCRFDSAYVPGGKDWHEEARRNDGTDIFSSDPVRDGIHFAWSKADPQLQVGNPTLKWVYETLQSVNALEDEVENITIPVLLGAAGQERLVDNKEMYEAAEKMPYAQIIRFPTAKHEILMETDDIRDAFLNEALNLFTRSA